MEKFQDNQGQSEHETHTTALIILVLIVVIIAAVAISWSNNPMDDAMNRSGTTTEPVESNGSTVPQSAVEVSESDSIADLPADLFVNESTITRNDVSYFGDNDQGTHRVVIFTTDRSQADLMTEYRSFFESNGFSINQEVEDELGAKIAGVTDDQQLTVSVGDVDAGTRVMITYVSDN